MNPWSNQGRVALFVVGSVVLASPAIAAEGVTLVIQPTSVTVSEEGSATIPVVARNGSGSTVTDLELKIFSDADVQLEAADYRLPQLAAGEDHLWEVRIRRASALLPANVFFRLRYRVREDDLTIVQFAFSSTRLTETEVPNPSNIANVGISASPGSIDEFTPARVFLTVQNVSARSLTVTDIRARSADFVTATPSEPDTPRTVEPGSTGLFSYEVAVGERVTTGRHQLSFVIEFEWRAGGSLRTAAIVASKELEIGVFAASAILSVLQVPLFAFLPGFLVLTMFLVIWNIRRADQNKITGSAFWVAAISISLLVVLLYPVAIGLFDESAPEGIIVSRYGFQDVVYVWLGSIVLGGAAGLIARLLKAKWGSAVSKLRALFTDTGNTSGRGGAKKAVVSPTQRSAGS